MRRADIAQSVDLLERVERAAGLTQSLKTEQARVVALLRQFDTGEYVQVQPNNDGWGYLVSYDLGGRNKTVNFGNDYIALADLALTRRQPVVVAAGLDRWAAHITRRLTQVGVTVIDDR